MNGTLINVAAILLGGALGLILGARVPQRLQQTVIAGMGLFTATIGIQMTFDSAQPLVLLGGVLIGGLLGEWWEIERRLRDLGGWLEKHFTRPAPAAPEPLLTDAEGASAPNPTPTEGSLFIRGFLTASLLYAIGPLAILGSIQDGLTGDYQLLAIKSVLDGFAAIAFASTLGVGVLFSSLVILVYQGSISLLAEQAQMLMTPAMMNEMTATGGILLIGIALSNLLEIKPIRVGNMLPALAISPLIVAILAALGIPLQ